jgi:hypothetical protein
MRKTLSVHAKLYLYGITTSNMVNSLSVYAKLYLYGIETTV